MLVMSSISMSEKIYDAFPLDLNSSCILMKRTDLGYGDSLDILLLPKITNGLMDTDVVFRKLVGHNLRRSITCFLWWFHDYGPNSSESAQYVLKKGTIRIFQYGSCRSIFFKSNESMEASCQALSKTRAESIRVFIQFLISPSLGRSDVAQQNR